MNRLAPWPLYEAMFILLLSTLLQGRVIYVDPSCDVDIPFDTSAPYFNMPRLLPALQSLKSQAEKFGYTCQLTKGTYNFSLDVSHTVVIDRINIGNLLKSYGVPSEKLVFLMLEPPVVRPENYIQTGHAAYTKIFTWKDDWVDSKKYFKFCYPFPWLCVSKFEPFEKRKLCTLISTFHATEYPNELYSKRSDTVRFFDSLDCNDFDLYGVWPSSHFKKCKGHISSKLDVLQNYKFCICYENYADYGYITEKIFDCFCAGVIPVYWGAHNIADYIDPNCYIDRRSFANDNALYTYLKNMPRKDYAEYIKNIINYLTSDKAFLFSVDYFVDSLLRILISSYDRSKLFEHETIKKIERCIAIQESIVIKTQAHP